MDFGGREECEILDSGDGQGLRLRVFPLVLPSALWLSSHLALLPVFPSDFLHSRFKLAWMRRFRRGCNAKVGGIFGQRRIGNRYRRLKVGVWDLEFYISFSRELR